MLREHINWGEKDLHRGYNLETGMGLIKSEVNLMLYSFVVRMVRSVIRGLADSIFPILRTLDASYKTQTEIIEVLYRLV